MMIEQIEQVTGNSTSISRVASEVARLIASSIVKISTRTLVRWYNMWYDFKMLPVDIPGKSIRKHTATWGETKLLALKNIVDIIKSSSLFR
mgnify:CR=1 FL=1